MDQRNVAGGEIRSMSIVTLETQEALGMGGGGGISGCRLQLGAGIEKRSGS